MVLCRKIRCVASVLQHCEELALPTYIMSRLVTALVLAKKPALQKHVVSGLLPLVEISNRLVLIATISISQVVYKQCERSNSNVIMIIFNLFMLLLLPKQNGTGRAQTPSSNGWKEEAELLFTRSTAQKYIPENLTTWVAGQLRLFSMLYTFGWETTMTVNATV